MGLEEKDESNWQGGGVNGKCKLRNARNLNID